MKPIIFAAIWTALYAVVVTAIACFIAWGVPDVAAWEAADRALALFVTACGIPLWSAIGLAVWERIE